MLPSVQLRMLLLALPRAVGNTLIAQTLLPEPPPLPPAPVIVGSRVEGTVRDAATGEPVTGVRVIADGPGGSQTVFTDEFGRYRFPLLAVGD